MREGQNIEVFTILIAEDDPDDRTLIEDAFQEIGFDGRYHVVRDGQELVDCLQQQGSYGGGGPIHPDVVLMDINMPRMNGVEALEALRADPKHRDIPVVMLTTSQNQDDIANSFSFGAHAFKVKPSSFSELVEFLKTVIAEYGPSRIESSTLDLTLS